jgi:trk system potassium uptake protein TrkA
MDMYIIVVGAGDIGTPLINMATHAEHEVVVIEKNEERATEAASAFDALVLNADATSDDTLEEAGIEDADAVISTTDQDAVNIMVMLLAKEFDIPNRVSVVHNPDHMPLFRQIGVNAIENPQQLIAEYLLQTVQRPAVTDFMHLAGDAEIFEIGVDEHAPIVGKTLVEADEEGLLGEDVLVIAVERGDETITSKGNTEVWAGDAVTVFSKRGLVPGATRSFSGDRNR